ncbi:DNA-binding protein [Actinoplanes sp. NBRC 103695]|nr:DNA-binding protein [Actinoplanes sp. NBRC 103695]
MGSDQEISKSRRAENAEQTRLAILAAARDLFTRRGYFQTKVGDIAIEARVSVAWVHAVGGGKSGLLRTLIENGVTTEDNAVMLERMTSITEPAELVRFLVQATRLRFAEWADLMRQVAAAAPQDVSVRQSQDIAHEGLRGALRLTAHRLADMGALKEKLDPDRATDLLWLYLSNTAYFLRTDELGWSLDESETWLIEILTQSLLAPRAQAGAPASNF